MDREMLIEAAKRSCEHNWMTNYLIPLCSECGFTEDGFRYFNRGVEKGFNAALAYHAKQNAEAEKLREDALKFYSADGSFTLGESPEQVIQARIEAAAKIEKLAKLEAWVSSLGKAVWRDGEICNRGEYGFALYDHSGAIIEHYPTLLAAIYAYLEQAEGGEAESLVRALKERSRLDPDAPNDIVFTSDAAGEY